jgi:hypothetical protein
MYRDKRSWMALCLCITFMGMSIISCVGEGGPIPDENFGFHEPDFDTELETEEDLIIWGGPKQPQWLKSVYTDNDGQESNIKSPTGMNPTMEVEDLEASMWFNIDEVDYMPDEYLALGLTGGDIVTFTQTSPGVWEIEAQYWVLNGDMAEPRWYEGSLEPLNYDFDRAAYEIWVDHYNGPLPANPMGALTFLTAAIVVLAIVVICLESDGNEISANSGNSGFHVQC